MNGHPHSAVQVIGHLPPDSQTISDWTQTNGADLDELLSTSAEAFLLSDGNIAEPHLAEWCALAIGGGHDRLLLDANALAVSRRLLERQRAKGADWNSLATRLWTGKVGGVTHRKSPLTLVPLRLKEWVNKRAGRPVFDLSFYLQYEPRSIEHLPGTLRYIPYTPVPRSRRRIALVTPHLGPGGAENVLFEVARSLDRGRDEIFVIATHSRDNRYERLWKEHADHVYDLARLSRPDLLPSLLYSIARNWAFDSVVVQNTLIGYCVLKSLKRDLPAVWITDIVHAVGRGWDVAAVTAGVSECIDRRIAVSDMARRHLIELGTSEDRIRLIRNGIDLDRFEPLPPFIRYPFEILFAARLDPVKRPLLLVDIAVELSRRKLPFPFRFVVAGDGPEMKALQRRIDRSGTQALFDLLGHVEDIPSLMSTAGVLLVTSSNEGIPLIIAEAFASARPVIASRVGAIDEILDENTGMLIDPHGNEAAAFADAILQLMNDARLRSRMGAAARRRVEAGYDRRRSRQLYREALETCN